MAPATTRDCNARNLHKIIQGVREQSLRKISELYGKFTGNADAAEVDEGFEGAIGNTGYTKIPKFMQNLISSKATSVGAGAAGELGLMGTTGFGGGKTTPEDRPEDSYKAVLARNACHFAPESWFVWAEHHKKALDLARPSKAKADEAVLQRARANPPADAAVQAQPVTPDDKMKAVVAAMAAEKEAASLANEAKLTDAFGSHYLQDSFASGHLINKTEIMKWYVQWFDANPVFAEGDSRLNVFLSPIFGRDESTPKTRRTPADKSEWAAAQSAAAQSGQGVSTGRYDPEKAGTVQPSDPQSIDNLGGSAADRFTAAGLKAPPSAEPGTKSQKVLVWWQTQAIDNRKKAAMKVDAAKLAAIAKEVGLSAPEVLQGLTNLIGDKIVVPEGKEQYLLREIWIPDKSSKAAFQDATAATKDPAVKQQKDAAYKQAAARASHKDFHKFMNSALLQASTSVLHDEFCKTGLTVSSKANQLPYKIYGDDAMLAAESAIGAVISANTSAMSTENITEMLATGHEKYAISAISNRFPSSVEATVGGNKQSLTLEQWHTGGVLKKHCESITFPTAANDTVKGWLQASASELKGFAEKISKDQIKPTDHSGEAF